MRSPKQPEPEQGWFDFDSRVAPLPEPPPSLAVAVVAVPVAVPVAVVLPAPVLAAPAVVVPISDKDKPHSVAELVRLAGRSLEARFGDVWVEGEISNLSLPRSGHVYFTLKDPDAQLPSVMFRTAAVRLGFKPEDGLKVRARGRLSIYEGQGKFQLYVEQLEPVGLGALQLAFEQLKKKLQAEGLFARERKRALPRWPRCIGLVTSPTGAVVRDVLRVSERRGKTSFLISPCQVQGASAPREIIAAMQRLYDQPGVDLIIVARGGGSAEDLAAFNDEALARAIAASPVPVVSAVGHEVDYTIADFVADVRAATPSAAAELCVPLFAEADGARRELHARLLSAGQRTIADARLRLESEVGRAGTALERAALRRRRGLDELATRLAGLHPRARLHRDRAALEQLSARLDTVTHRLLTQRRQALGAIAGKLDVLSPLASLSRGYSLTRTAEGHVVTRADQVAVGDSVSVQLSAGTLDCLVQSRVETEKGATD